MTAQAASTVLHCLLLLLATLGNVDGGISKFDDLSPSKVAGNSSLPYASFPNHVKDPVGDSFKIIGGVSTVKPSCVSWGPGRVDCFIRTKTGSIGHWTKQDGVAKEWEDLDGIVVGNIECVSRQTGHIDVLITDQMSYLCVKSFDASTGKWSELTKFKQTLLEAPSCASRTPSNIECMGRDLSGYPIWIDCKNGSWSHGRRKQVQMRYPCEVSYRSNELTNQWCVAPDGRLRQSWRRNGRRNDWRVKGPVDRRLVGQPEAISINSKRIDALVRSTKNELMHLAWNGDWQEWVNLGGSIVDAPSCVAIDPSLHCFMVGTDARLYRRSLENDNWSEWLCAYGTFMEGPSCVVSNPAKKEISCYLRGSSHRIVEKVYRM